MKGSLAINGSVAEFHLLLYWRFISGIYFPVCIYNSGFIPAQTGTYHFSQRDSPQTHSGEGDILLCVCVCVIIFGREDIVYALSHLYSSANVCVRCCKEVHSI